ncbi:MAG TPA: hypothetical protein DCQ37_18455 [Desulfobacteraceae bacterium]|jgi:hypothetical protein|nr:hypothetical protein [Desulfobacteraceae bacterium]
MKPIFILRQIKISHRQLQKKFKHAADFGIYGSYSEVNAAKFEQAIRKFMNNSANKVFEGSYRGKVCIFHVNPQTRLNVITDHDENFISGWKLNPQQLQILLESAKLGGI